MREVAEVFHPGEFLREELEERGWTQTDFAEILGRPSRLVSELLNGGRSVTADTAKGLGEALGTGAELWMRLQASFDLQQAAKKDDDVARRSRLYSVAPIREMIRRGWIEESKNVEVVEKRVCDFFEISSIDEEPSLAYAAKTSLADHTTAQRAWLFRAKALARSASAESFTQAKLRKCLQDLRVFMADVEEARHVPACLAEAGIRLVIVEPLPKTRIDGAHFRLSAKEPVVALSMRFNRVDSFWYVLGHELGHLLNNHAPHVDADLGENLHDDERESVANQFSKKFVIPDGELDRFIARVGPMYSKKQIAGFAKRIGVHPGIVVGQLQFRKEIGYQQMRNTLEKIREFLIPATITDGWGCVAPPGL